MNPKYNDKISNKSNFDDFESNNLIDHHTQGEKYDLEISNK